MQVKGDLIQAVIAFCRAANDTEADSSRKAVIDLLQERPVNAGSDILVPHASVADVLRGHSCPLDELDDRQLSDLNGLLPWGAMTSDRQGRAVGEAWSAIKRAGQSPLIDPRLRQFATRYPIAGKHVLEVGCFEGIHTIGNLALGATVTAVDSRMENILKTLTRLWAYGLSADVQAWDLERAEVPSTIPATWDMLHHIGVLYHQTNPAESLAMLLDRTREAVILDTHVASRPDTVTGQYEALGRTFSYEHQTERPISPFAGMRDHAKWLLASDLQQICEDRGFTVERNDVRQERNGARTLIWAFR